MQSRGITEEKEKSLPASFSPTSFISSASQAKCVCSAYDHRLYDNYEMGKIAVSCLPGEQRALACVRVKESDAHAQDGSAKKVEHHNVDCTIDPVSISFPLRHRCCHCFVTFLLILCDAQCALWCNHFLSHHSSHFHSNAHAVSLCCRYSHRVRAPAYAKLNVSLVRSIDHH